MSTPKQEDSKPAMAAPQPAPAAAAPATPAPATPAPTTTTPAPTYATTPWAATGATHATTIPYQHYQAYSSHYPQAAYGHYQYATPLTAQTMQAQLSRPATVSTPIPNTATASTATTATTTAANTTTVDTTDVATLNDALGSAGVDLRAEEESLQRSHDQHQPYRPYEDRTRKQPLKPSFDTIHLGTKMRTIGTSHKVTRIPDDAINYLALALRARLQDLITNMIAASHHRTDTQFDRPASFYTDETPMWRISVRSDVAKQLAVLERVEREEEMKVRRERKERAEMTAAHAAALAAQANGAAAASGTNGDGGGASGMEEEGGSKKKRKKDGPGVTARNMSEDVRKKMSNAVATQAAGLGGKYAWMTAANASAATPKKPAVAAPTATTSTPATTTATPMTTASTSTATTSIAATATTPAATTGSSAASTWARPYVHTKKSSSTTPAQASMEEDTRTMVTMRDAVFVIEKERGHGGGKGAARGFI